jgi:hypothetical protein
MPVRIMNASNYYAWEYLGKRLFELFFCPLIELAVQATHLAWLLHPSQIVATVL